MPRAQPRALARPLVGASRAGKDQRGGSWLCLLLKNFQGYPRRELRHRTVEASCSEREVQMAIGPDQKAAFVAFNRFSFGARGGAYAGDLARAASDPRGFLKAELMQPAIAHLDTPGLPQTKTALATLFAFREQRRRDREGMAEAKPSPKAPPAAPPQNPSMSEAKPPPPPPPAAPAMPPAASAEAQPKPP